MYLYICITQQKMIYKDSDIFIFFMAGFLDVFSIKCFNRPPPSPASPGHLHHGRHWRSKKDNNLSRIISVIHGCTSVLAACSKNISKLSPYLGDSAHLLSSLPCYEYQQRRKRRTSFRLASAMETIHLS